MSISYTTARRIGARSTRIEGHAGEVVLAGDAGWDDARRAWNLHVDQQPAAVAFATSADDVAAAIRFAGDTGLRVAVQGTGHGAAALGDLGDSLLIRTSRMRDVRIDPVARRARVEAGALWDDVVQPAAAHGLVALHGSSPDVGVVGYSLGGGIGWLARLYGLASSSITAIELVTASGEIVRVDDDHDPDLFWGLRGGGGNFGVVTALELELFPLDRAYAGWLVWDWSRAEDVLDRWVEWTSTAPTGITSVARILRLPPLEVIPEPLRGRELVVVEAAYAGNDATGAKLVQPLRELGPELDTFAMIPAAGLARLHRDPEGPTPGIGSGGLVDELSPSAIDAYLAVAGPGSGTTLVSSELRQLGGALGRPAPGGGALSHLDGAFAHFSVGVPGDAEATRAVEQRIADVAAALEPWGSGRLFTNFADKAEDARSMFSAGTYNRLRALKVRMDPGGVFRAGQVIPAASDVS